MTLRFGLLLASVCLAAALAQTPAPQYTIGGGDEISIALADAEELKDAFISPFVVDSDGYINVPLVGRMHAASLTPAQLQVEIHDGLKKYIRDPHVSVNIRTMKSQTVSVLGAVNTPGVHPITGPKTLAEAIAQAGGLSKDAGYKIVLSREKKWGPIPLPGSKPDVTGQFFVAEMRTRDLTESHDPAENIKVKPDDVITVPRAEVVYVIGEVHKPGGFTLGDRREVSVLEALSLAEGTTSTASQGHAKILRTVPGSTERAQIKVDLKKILKGQSKDIELTASDILFVPDNSTKRAGIKTAEAALQTISGVIIWRGL